MKNVFDFFKKHTNVLIPLTGFLCLAAFCAEFIVYIYFLSSVAELDYSLVMSSFVSGIFVYGVGVFMMVYGKSKNNERMQRLIVILSGVYLCVTNFVEGTSISLGDILTTLWSIVALMIGLCWVFILYEVGFAYMRNDVNRAVSYVTYTGSLIIVLNIAFVVLGFFVGGLTMLLSSLVSFFYVCCLYASYIDINYVISGGSGSDSHKRYKKEQDRNKQDIDDLDIHSF